VAKPGVGDTAQASGGGISLVAGEGPWARRLARYALAYLESNALPHEVRTFISFDSPQAGANIPLGIQYWLAFFADNQTYVGMNLAALQGIDAGISSTLSVGSVAVDSYCIESTVGGQDASLTGPGGTIATTTC